MRPDPDGVVRTRYTGAGMVEDFRDALRTTDPLDSDPGERAARQEYVREQRYYAELDAEETREQLEQRRAQTMAAVETRDKRWRREAAEADREREQEAYELQQAEQAAATNHWTQWIRDEIATSRAIILQSVAEALGAVIGKARKRERRLATEIDRLTREVSELRDKLTKLQP